MDGVEPGPNANADSDAKLKDFLQTTANKTPAISSIEWMERQERYHARCIEENRFFVLHSYSPIWISDAGDTDR